MSIDNELQAAIYTAVSGGDYTVYDHVPQGTDYPYITITQSDSSEEDFLNTRVERHFIYFTCWSDYRGSYQVNQMLDRIVQTLHRKTLTLDSGAVCAVWVSSRRAAPDMDGETYQGSATVTALITID